MNGIFFPTPSSVDFGISSFTAEYFNRIGLHSKNISQSVSTAIDRCAVNLRWINIEKVKRFSRHLTVEVQGKMSNKLGKNK
jgi:hypothetical protein